MSSTTLADGFRTAVLLPCHNVGATIGAVVRGFAAALPGARIYVFDNNSTDDTAREAAHAGARVFRESRQGTGAVLRRMFADIEADVYVMAAGDGSSDPADAPSLVNALITEHVDMVVGTWPKLDDAPPSKASGYRAFTRRFVKSFPAVSDRLGIETEMSVHAAQLMIPVAEIELSGVQPAAEDRRGAPAGMAGRAEVVRETRPAAFYGVAAILLAVFGAVLLLSTSSIPAMLIGTALLLSGSVVAALGLIIERLDRARIEQKRILFLAVPRLGVQ